MILTGMMIGAGVMTTSLIGILTNKDLRFRRKVLTAFRKYDLIYKKRKDVWNGIKILQFFKTTYGYQMMINLPVGVTTKMVADKLKALEEATFSNIRFFHINGTICQLDFATTKVPNYVKYEQIEKAGHRVPLMSAFGPVYIDFENEGSYHMLVGGATRMGKTKFIEMLTYHLLTSYRERVRICIASPKITDFKPFQNIPQIRLCETFSQTREMLSNLFQIIEVRKTQLKDGKENFDPIFLIVDEFGRFGGKSEEDIMDQFTEVVETAGYLNVHMILASQRTDATTVLKPRIRANLLVNMAFTTRDESNSTLIIGSPDAAYLGKVKGRAVLVDGFKETVQVPIVENMNLKEFKRYDQPRQIDNEAAPSLPSFITGSVRGDDLSRSSETLCDDQSNYETAQSGWDRLADSPA